MSGSDVFQTIGAAAGVLAFAWNLIAQRYGTFTDQTLKDTIEGIRKDAQQNMDRLERIALRQPLQRRS